MIGSALLLACEWLAAAGFGLAVTLGLLLDPVWFAAAAILLAAGLYARHVAASTRPAGRVSARVLRARPERVL